MVQQSPDLAAHTHHEPDRQEHQDRRVPRGGGRAGIDQRKNPAGRAILHRRYRDVALQLRADVDQGASAFCWVANASIGWVLYGIHHPKRVASRTNTGMVFVNHPTWTAPDLAFRGVMNSGYGRELSGLGDVPLVGTVHQKPRQKFVGERFRCRCCDAPWGTARRAPPVYALALVRSGCGDSLGPRCRHSCSGWYR